MDAIACRCWRASMGDSACARCPSQRAWRCHNQSRRMRIGFMRQDEGFDCGVRPLGVQAITTCGEPCIAGPSCRLVHRYPRQWEFAPGGGVEPGCSPEDVLLRELDEEAGCSPAGPPVAVAVVLDEEARTWEVVYRLEVQTEVLTPSTDEYSELRWCSIEALPAPRSPITECMRGLLAE